MSDDITLEKVLVLINERDKHTQDKLVDIAKTLEKVCNHVIVSEEDKKHDAEFKKEIRAHIKFAEPILYKAQDHQAIRVKMFILISSFFVMGALGAIVKFG